MEKLKEIDWATLLDARLFGVAFSYPAVPVFVACGFCAGENYGGLVMPLIFDLKFISMLASQMNGTHSSSSFNIPTDSVTLSITVDARILEFDFFCNFVMSI